MREIPFSSVPPSNSLVSVLEGLFELTRRPSRALDLPRALLPELQRCKDTVCHARLGGPRTPSTTTDANLECPFAENALFYTDPRLQKGQQKINELVVRRGLQTGRTHAGQKRRLRLFQTPQLRGLVLLVNINTGI